MSDSIQKKPRPGPSRELDTFDNPHPDRDVVIRIHTHEFTCHCPMTDQPDFATIHVEYIPNLKCVELKSLKLYFWSYRDEGAFHEKVTGQILNDLVSAIDPRFMRVTSDFNVRGGVYTKTVVEHRASDWQPEPPVVLPAAAK
ncbi:MAG: preQ(1) synthase [Pseudomonadota bacterium]